MLIRSTWIMAIFLCLLVAIFGTSRDGRAEAGGHVAAGVILRYGSNGTEVRSLQDILRQLGYFQGPTSGYFGAQTRDAVKRFQSAMGLDADGVFGPRTRAAIERATQQATYVVKRGDSLGEIARKHGVSLAEIAERNGIANPDRLREGQKLIIPARPPAVKPQPQAAATRSAAPSARPAAPSPPIPPPVAGERLDGEALPRSAALTAAPSSGRLALTFNDGPDPETLPLILAALAGHGVRATFFIVGERAEAYPELVRQIAAGGHQIDNHSYTHRDLTRLDAAGIRSEISRTAELIKGLTGQQTRYFRPPLGAFDPDTLKAINGSGHRMLLWTNVGAPDQPAPASASQLVDRIAGAAFDGAIIMLHADSRKTAEALPALLSRLKQERYKLVTVNALLAGARGGD